MTSREAVDAAARSLEEAVTELEKARSMVRAQRKALIAAQELYENSLAAELAERLAGLSAEEARRVCRKMESAILSKPTSGETSPRKEEGGCRTPDVEVQPQTTPSGARPQTLEAEGSCRGVAATVGENSKKAKRKRSSGKKKATKSSSEGVASQTGESTPQGNDGLGPPETLNLSKNVQPAEQPTAGHAVIPGEIVPRKPKSARSSFPATSLRSLPMGSKAECQAALDRIVNIFYGRCGLFAPEPTISGSVQTPTRVPPKHAPLVNSLVELGVALDSAVRCALAYPEDSALYVVAGKRLHAHHVHERRKASKEGN